MISLLSGRNSKAYRKFCSIGLVLVVLSIVIVNSAFISVWISFHDVISSVPKLGSGNDTIILQTVNGFFHSSITVTTCDQQGDSPHINRIFLIPMADLILHNTSYSLDYNQFDQDSPSAVTGQIENQYLLKGSKISYQMCLGSMGSDKMYAYLFLFNNGFDFSQYQRTPTLGENLSILKRRVEIGTNNSTQCFQLMFEVPKSSYYFLALRTPGKIFYTYKYTLNINYYDHNEYAMVCSIYDNKPCHIDVPGSLFSSEDYTLLAYVRPNVELSSVTNHVCVSASRSDSVNAIVGMTASIASLALLVILVFVFVVVVRVLRHRNRQGYTTIQNDSPPLYQYKY